jgi:hypothetical protein
MGQLAPAGWATVRVQNGESRSPCGRTDSEIVRALEISRMRPNAARHFALLFITLHAEVRLHREQRQQVHQAHLHGVQVHEVQRIEYAGGLPMATQFFSQAFVRRPGWRSRTNDGLQRHARRGFELRWLRCRSLQYACWTWMHTWLAASDTQRRAAREFPSRWARATVVRRRR